MAPCGSALTAGHSGFLPNFSPTTWRHADDCLDLLRRDGRTASSMLEGRRLRRRICLGRFLRSSMPKAARFASGRRRTVARIFLGLGRPVTRLSRIEAGSIVKRRLIFALRQSASRWKAVKSRLALSNTLFGLDQTSHGATHLLAKRKQASFTCQMTTSLTWRPRQGTTSIS